MTNKKIELVELDKLPTQEGTEFILIFNLHGHDKVHSYAYKILDSGRISYPGNLLIDFNRVNIIKILALPHAELRALYEEKHEKYSDFEYLQEFNDTWRMCERKPNWLLDIEYRYNPRHKQKYILINNERVPEPIKHELDKGDRYFFIDLYALNIGFNYWDNDLDDKRLLKLRCIHLTRDDAKTHLDAIIKVNNQEGVYLDD